MNSNPVSESLATIEELGNGIPFSWFHHIKFSSGKPDLLAILILDAIVRRYIPKAKRFSGDKLQLDYSKFAAHFNVTHREARDAIHRLADGNILDTELRTVTNLAGKPCSNVLYLSPVPDGIASISIPIPADMRPSVSLFRRHRGVVRSNVPGGGTAGCTRGGTLKCARVVPQDVPGGGAPGCATYTDTRNTSTNTVPKEQVETTHPTDALGPVLSNSEYRIGAAYGTAVLRRVHPKHTAEKTNAKTEPVSVPLISPTSPKTKTAVVKPPPTTSTAVDPFAGAPSDPGHNPYPVGSAKALKWIADNAVSQCVKGAEGIGTGVLTPTRTPGQPRLAVKPAEGKGTARRVIWNRGQLGEPVRQEGT